MLEWEMVLTTYAAWLQTCDDDATSCFCSTLMARFSLAHSSCNSVLGCSDQQCTFHTPPSAIFPICVLLIWKRHFERRRNYVIAINVMLPFVGILGWSMIKNIDNISISLCYSYVQIAAGIFLPRHNVALIDSSIPCVCIIKYNSSCFLPYATGINKNKTTNNTETVYMLNGNTVTWHFNNIRLMIIITIMWTAAICGS